MKFFALSIILVLFIFLSGTIFNKVLSQVQYQVNSIFIGILSNGDSIVQYDLRMKNNTNEITLPLIGGNISDILVKNYLSKYLGYSFNSVTNEIKINIQNESQLRITYQTPGLVNKQEREWSFFIDSAFPFTVKLPNDAVVTNLGEQSPSLIRKLGGQNLLSFDKGKISIDYVIGYAGTREQAIISISSAELDLAKAESEHVGINLDEVNSILNRAKTAVNQSNFIEAERLANNASDISRRVAESYETSKDMISNATRKVEDAQAMNTDASQASEFISKSNIEFSQGNYPKALEYATLAVNSLDVTKQEQMSPGSSSSTFLFLIPLAVSVGFFIIVKYRSKIIPHLQSTRFKKDTLNNDLTPNTLQENNLTEKQPPMKEQVNIDSSTQSDLHRLVADVIKQKGNLKPEEREILFYISEKEGAAFEGEIRNKFILPKTSLWRLIKRLEREDLIEVTKIGGQNLIKLKIQK
ncbi:MAG: hypothetical protein E6L04_07175 [Thaumarchaeota archaeon]|nr:MAG: hypothetical protein E6L04_07175 [Nitrososphaerota archaeon]